MGLVFTIEGLGFATRHRFSDRARWLQRELVLFLGFGGVGGVIPYGSSSIIKTVLHRSTAT